MKSTLTEIEIIEMNDNIRNAWIAGTVLIIGGLFNIVATFLKENNVIDTLFSFIGLAIIVFLTIEIYRKKRHAALILALFYFSLIVPSLIAFQNHKTNLISVIILYFLITGTISLFKNYKHFIKPQMD